LIHARRGKTGEIPSAISVDNQLCKTGEEVIVDIGTGFKLLAFMFWPVLLMLIAFLLDRKRFKKRWEKFKQEGFFKSK